MKKNFPFHMVTLSPWPIILSLNLMNLLLSIIIWIYFSYFMNMIFNLTLLIFSMLMWFRDIIRESTFQGMHSMYIIMMMKFSMIMFIISELFFFISFFWTFFHNSISPSIEINSMWPPKMIKFFNPFEVPLLNSIILILSGFTVTLSHYNMLNNKFNSSVNMLKLTIVLGFYFNFMQIFEYYNSFFCINDSIYGSIFYLSTGFHGFHVLVGTLMLFYSLIRMLNNHFSPTHHINFEFSIWYWHFVDVIWLFLYMFYYILMN
uniref:Cytochrome c oxidase subunit 3 n=1 Tax=Bombus filchnerae TaxID=395525 RepID=A0A8E5HI31_9HYME|nr:cytochrome c oxidase subunit III [Bombus filchnerae]QTZ18839.1 cytochrome c oxidase subunit 3 [Bombus filchnerae]WKW52606.1 cytochrome c oxidase subunit 3 [Bombus filchnerae]